ncbi:MAG: hypothetical protein ACLQPD_26150 [Desulfomonilaceae bacterium]
MRKLEEKRQSEPQKKTAVEEKAYATEEQYIRDELKPESGKAEVGAEDGLPVTEKRHLKRFLAFWALSIAASPNRPRLPTPKMCLTGGRAGRCARKHDKRGSFIT